MSSHNFLTAATFLGALAVAGFLATFLLGDFFFAACLFLATVDDKSFFVFCS